jgi:hypothetical protein
VLLAATVTGAVQYSHPILRFKATRPAGGDTKATARAEFLNNRGKPFERVFVFHAISSVQLRTQSAGSLTSGIVSGGTQIRSDFSH